MYNATCLISYSCVLPVDIGIIAPIDRFEIGLEEGGLQVCFDESQGRGLVVLPWFIRCVALHMQLALTCKITEKSSKTVRAGIEKCNWNPDLVRQFSWNIWFLCIFQILLQANFLRKRQAHLGIVRDSSDLWEAGSIHLPPGRGCDARFYIEFDCYYILFNAVFLPFKAA